MKLMERKYDWCESKTKFCLYVAGNTLETDSTRIYLPNFIVNIIESFEDILRYNKLH